MERADIKELHYITPIANMISIMHRGILSNELSKNVPHESIAMVEMQDKRKIKRIPGAKKLHEYVNLYFDAHNPMLSKRRSQNNQICVLCVNPSVLDLPNVIISDRNAAADYPRFDTVEAGLAALNKEKVFATFWLHPENQFEEWAHKSAKCAEVLVPDKVEPEYILGAYVANRIALKALRKLKIDLTVCIKSGMFFS